MFLDMYTILLVIILILTTHSYVNPVQGNQDSPDPGVIYNNGAYYAVTT
jgi:hypothetical protein